MIAMHERCLAQRYIPLHLLVTRAARVGFSFAAFIPGTAILLLCIAFNALSTMLWKFSGIDWMRRWYEQGTCCEQCGYRSVLTNCPRCKSMHRVPQFVLVHGGKFG